MGILLLKSSACLAILMLFYKIVLETLSHHYFKRFYLLAALLISAIIPFIAFIKYVEPTFDFGVYDPESMTTPPYFPTELPTITEEQPNTFLPTLLWTVYAIGVIVFSTQFILNLFKISSKIKRHQKVKTNDFINVLIEKLAIPHTFFNYIFLNKSAFENNKIPQEVLLHEQTHAKQKHSLDILFLEILQIIFWFNPLLYFIKKDIKLNHEFLADQQVLKSGYHPKTYQNLLLRFSSNQKELALVNAINYMSIKKRLTIMNTQTSHRTKWLRSLLLLPVLALLLFSFSQTKEVEKELTPAIFIQDQSNGVVKNIEEKLEKVNSLKINYINPTLEINQNPLSLKLNGKPTSLQNLKEDFMKTTNGKKSEINIEAMGEVDLALIEKIFKIITKEYVSKFNLSECAYVVSYGKLQKQGIAKPQETKTMLGYSVYNNEPIYANKKAIIASPVGTTSKQKVLSFNFKVPGQPTVRVKGNLLNSKAIEYLNEAKDGTKLQYFNIKIEGEKHSPPMIVYVTEKTNSDKILPTLNGKVCIECEALIKLNELKNIKIGTNTNAQVKSFKIKLPKHPTVIVNGSSPNNKAISFLNEAKNNDLITIFDIKTKNEILKNYIVLIAVDEKIKQSENSSEEFKNIPPPPPPIPQNPTKEQKEKYEKISEEYYRKYKIVDGKPIKIPEPPKPKNLKKEPKPPAPPKPKSPLDTVVEMAKKGATFYYNNEKITSDKAIKLLKENKNLNISSSTNNGVSTVHISDKPIKIVNGKVVND